MEAEPPPPPPQPETLHLIQSAVMKKCVGVVRVTLRYPGDGRLEARFMKLNPKQPKSPFSTKDVRRKAGYPGNQFGRFLKNKAQIIPLPVQQLL